MSYDTTYEFAGEAQMTSAIEYVTSDNLPVVYLLNGNGESSLSSDFSSILADDNFRTEQLSLITGDGKVPSDASCVLLNVPQNDLSEDEVSALEEYIDGGGKVIMITYYPYTLANLNALGERYGLSRVPGLLVEGSDSMYAKREALLSAALYREHRYLLYALRKQCIYHCARGTRNTEG